MLYVGVVIAALCYLPLFFQMSSTGSTAVARSYRATGRVQNVMFRQTLIRALLRRGLEGGATNRRDDRRAVDFTVVGAPSAIEELIDRLSDGQPINDWGARVESVVPLADESRTDYRSHQVTTDNVDQFNWNPNVKMYI